MRSLLAVAAFGLLAGCAAGGGVTETRAPDGSAMKNTKCSKDAMVCFKAASESCNETNGSYRVVASHSNSGGILADLLPGPVTWYNMTYICGPSDGKMPEFPLKGSAPAMPVMPVVPAPTSNKPVQTNCNRIGNSVSCMSY